MNNLESGKSFSNVLAKKMAAVALVAALTVGSAGCNSKQIDSGENNNPPITGTVTPETNPTNTKPIETKTARQLELEALLTKAPEIDGLTKKIEGDKVIYQNENKVESGYYVEKAYYNNQETDGVSLSIDVIKKLIDKKEETGPNTSFSLPIDPSEGQVVSVEFQQERIKSGQTFKNGYFYIHSETPINIVNSFADNQKIRRANSSTDSGITLDESCRVVSNDNYLISGTLTFILIQSRIINPVFPSSQPYSSFLGELLGQMRGTLVFERASANWEDLNKYFAYESNLLKINNSLVFTMEKGSK